MSKLIGRLLVVFAFVWAGAAHCGPLYSNYGNSTWAIDLTDGSATPIINNSGSALVYGDGFLYTSYAGATWVVDPSDGTTTLLNNQSNSTLAYAPIAPIPIPTTIWLFGSALLGLVASKRRRS